MTGQEGWLSTGTTGTSGISDSGESPRWDPQPSFLRDEHCRAVPVP